MAAVLYEIDNDGKDDYEFNETVFEDAVSEDDKPISIQDNKGRSFCVCPHVYVKMGTDTIGPSPFSGPGKTEDCTLVAKMI